MTKEKMPARVTITVQVKEFQQGESLQDEALFNEIAKKVWDDNRDFLEQISFDGYPIFTTIINFVVKDQTVATVEIFPCITDNF